MKTTLNPTFKIINSDCLDAMRVMEENSVDAIVTDPPYGIDFMGKGWDHGVPDEPFWKEALRVAKPGAHLLAFGGSRTYHRLACAIEDAGWEIRDCIMWVYSSGFPKSMDVSKAIDKTKGAEREIVGVSTNGAGASQQKLKNHERGDTGIGMLDGSGKTFNITAPASPEAKQWSGWGTCLKPAVEPIVLARKPIDGTIAENVLKYGTGGLNIDACRVPSEEAITIHSPAKETLFESGHKDLGTWKNTSGRFPANFIHDGSEEIVSLFPNSSDGSVARFFYCPKASTKERGEENDHPTVKPIALMRYLVKLVCPIGGVVLDPFCGSGTTGLACLHENMNFIGCEKEPHYAEIANNRIGALAEKQSPPKPTTDGTPKLDDFNFDEIETV